MSDEHGYGSNGVTGHPQGADGGGQGYQDYGSSQHGTPQEGAQRQEPLSHYDGIDVSFDTNAIFGTNTAVPTKAPRGMDFESIVDSNPVSADSYTADGDNSVDMKRRSLLNVKLTNGRRVELVVSLVLAIAMIFVHSAMGTGAAGIVTATIMNAAFAWLCFSLVRTCFKYDLAFVTGLRRAVIVILVLLGVASLAGLVYYGMDVPGVFNPSTAQLSALQVQGNNTAGPYTVTGKESSGGTMTFAITQDEYYACNTGLSGVDTKYRSATVTYLPHTKTVVSLSCGSSK